MMTPKGISAGGADYYAKDDYYFGRESDAGGASGSADGAGFAGGAGDGDGSARDGDQLTALTWGGKGAERLGLSGKADLNAFHLVMDGKNPNPDGPPLSKADRLARAAKAPDAEVKASGRAHHRAGVDLTFSAPKSVSVAALVAGDERVLTAHTAAVDKAMNFVEAHYSITRQRNGDRGVDNVLAGNLTYAKTTHATSRSGDPQLHDHVVVANAVFDERSGEWRALETRQIYENQITVGLIYQRELAGGLMKLGYDVASENSRGTDRTRDGSFKIADVPQPVIDHFSKRHQQILANAADLKPQTAAQFELAVQKDRPHKHDLPAAEFRQLWRKAAMALGFDAKAWAAEKDPSEPGRDLTSQQRGKVSEFAASVQRIVTGLQGVFGKAADPYGYKRSDAAGGRDPAAREAVSHAIQVMEAKSAVFTQAGVLNVAMRTAPAEVSFEALQHQMNMLAADGRLKTAETKLHEGLTTERALKIESQIVANMKTGIGQSEPIYEVEAGIRRAMAGVTMADGTKLTLDPGQVKAAALILTSPDKVVAVQGVAGSGKSTLFALVGQAAREKAGDIMVGMAALHGAKEGLADKGGFEAMTVARFLAINRGVADGKIPPTAKQLETWRGKVVILDEASMLNNADALRITNLIDKLELRKVALIGDRMQLPGLGAGAPFAMLLDKLVPQAEMTTIRRQKDETLKAAVGELSLGQAKGLHRLLGDIVEAGERAGIAALASKAYVEWKASHDNGVVRPVITATQAERRAVNHLILGGLERAGSIVKIGSDREALALKSLMGPERWRAHNYAEGDVLVFHSRLESAGIAKGEHAVVIGINGAKGVNLLQVQQVDGRTASIPLSPMIRKGEEKFSTYTSQREEGLFAGARYVFERTNLAEDIDVKAGEGFTVLGLKDGQISMKLDSGRTLSMSADDKQMKFVGPGYAMTTHRSQGLTMETNPIGLLSSRNATMAGAYVEVSRAVHGITIITDSFEALKWRITDRDGQNLIASFNLREPAEPSQAQTPFDPSLNKPLPDKSFVADRPMIPDRSK